jgi:hypothetical protein
VGIRLASQERRLKPQNIPEVEDGLRLVFAL